MQHVPLQNRVLFQPFLCHLFILHNFPTSPLPHFIILYFFLTISKKWITFARTHAHHFFVALLSNIFQVKWKKEKEKHVWITASACVWLSFIHTRARVCVRTIQLLCGLVLHLLEYHRVTYSKNKQVLIPFWSAVKHLCHHIQCSISMVYGNVCYCMHSEKWANTKCT